MQSVKHIGSGLAVAAALLAFSCETNQVIGPVGFNTPEFTAESNYFSYRISATACTLDQSIPLNFTADLTEISYATNEHAGGIGQVSVHFRNNIVYTLGVVPGRTNSVYRLPIQSPPDTVRISLSGFTGNLAMSISAVRGGTLLP